ncbi:MAG: PspA/IM30 family protein [Acidimicrobiales bacterium]
MSLFHRLSLVFQQKANAALDKAEDPNEALDLSYQKLLEQLQQVRRAIADVLTSEKRLEGQRVALQAQHDKLQGQARQALTQGQEPIARTALSRAEVISQQLVGLGPQIDQLKGQESQLELTGQKLQAKVEAFRTQRETMKAQYTAAKASTQAVEGLSGISEQMADVSLMLDRAQDKVANMQARASAVGELADSGVLDTFELGPGSGDDIDRQLRQAGGSAVDQQLAAMKAQMSVGAGSSSDRPAGALGVGSIVVRVAGDQQYKLPEAVRPALDGLDSALARAVESGDVDGFAGCTSELAKLIQTNGEKLPADELRPSDLIVPSAQMTLEEAKALLAEGASGGGGTA